MLNEKCGKASCLPSMIAKILLVVGGLNWGLYGVGMLLGSDLNLVYLILGGIPMLEALVYVLVGVSAVVFLVGCKCKKCSACCQAGSNTEGGMSAGVNM